MTLLVGEPQMTDSFSLVLERLVDLEREIDDRLNVYEWRPRQPDFPALWNFLNDAPLGMTSNVNFRETFTFLVQFAVRPTDGREEHRVLSEIAENLRQVVDPALHTIHPLGAKRAIRRNMRTAFYRFGSGEQQFTVLGMEAPIEIEIDRLLPANPLGGTP